MSRRNAGSVREIRLTNSTEKQKTSQECAGAAILQSSADRSLVDTLTELFSTFAVELEVIRHGASGVAMSEHRATISWNRDSEDFSYQAYSRNHTWEFENGIKIDASAAQDFLGTPENLDPEEAYVAALSSCHMLTFLAIAARQRLIVDSYTDSAVGYLEKNPSGKLAVTRVTLRPRVSFSEGATPSPEKLEKLHHLAHEECFIANSVHTSISVESG